MATLPFPDATGMSGGSSVTMLQRAHPFERRVHHDIKAYGLGHDVLLQSAESQADVERAVAARHQTGEAEALAVAPTAAPAATPSSSTPAAADSE
eukprot:6152943-Pleurochrysis_carterae.AAC.1